MSGFFELPPRRAGEFDPVAAVDACIESGETRLLMDVDALPPELFDLSTRVAGTLVQRLVMYGIRMAAVVPDPSIHSAPFQDFAREANAGRQYRFFPTRAAAVEWLIAG